MERPEVRIADERADQNDEAENPKPARDRRAQGQAQTETRQREKQHDASRDDRL